MGSESVWNPRFSRTRDNQWSEALAELPDPTPPADPAPAVTVTEATEALLLFAAEPLPINGMACVLARACARERERAAARVAELEAALRPFAEYASRNDSVPANKTTPDIVPLSINFELWDGRQPTVGDCRRAAALLAGTPPTAPEGPPP